MKRLVSITVIVLLVMSLVGGCFGQKEKEKESQPPVSEQPVSQEAGKDADETAGQENNSGDSGETSTDGEPGVIVVDNKPRADASYSKLSEILVKDPLFLLINSSKEEIELLLGEPDEVDYWSGAEYYYYQKENLVLYFGGNAKFDDGNHVTSVQALAGEKVIGITVGKTLGEIKQVLGEPTSQGYNEMDMSYNIIYQIGEHSLMFSAETEDGPTYEGQIFGYNQ